MVITPTLHDPAELFENTTTLAPESLAASAVATKLLTTSGVPWIHAEVLLLGWEHMAGVPVNQMRA